MRDLAAGVARFQRDVLPAKADLFAHLATNHTPHTLFIGCSDARVVPELITGSEPGDLFVIRTAGNLVPAYHPGVDGVAASIEYAVAVLGVSDIVVCGHSACGAMTDLAERRDLTGTPAIADWLRPRGRLMRPHTRLRGRVGAGPPERTRSVGKPRHAPLGRPRPGAQDGGSARLGFRHRHRSP
ncbi:carbonic anhydrase [Nonomuraea jabiensis]|uniref:carbonic anhydrase n=1 Tax=Nonomuraea jabiensis TaxID=882448 RepID=UPI003D720F5E